MWGTSDKKTSHLLLRLVAPACFSAARSSGALCPRRTDTRGRYPSVPPSIGRAGPMDSGLHTADSRWWVPLYFSSFSPHPGPFVPPRPCAGPPGTRCAACGTHIDLMHAAHGMCREQRARQGGTLKRETREQHFKTSAAVSARAPRTRRRRRRRQPKGARRNSRSTAAGRPRAEPV